MMQDKYLIEDLEQLKKSWDRRIENLEYELERMKKSSEQLRELIERTKSVMTDQPVSAEEANLDELDESEEPEMDDLSKELSSLLQALDDF